MIAWPFAAAVEFSLALAVFVVVARMVWGRYAASPRTHTANPSGTSDTGVETPTTARMNRMPATILVTRPMLMRRSSMVVPRGGAIQLVREGYALVRDSTTGDAQNEPVRD